jgi:DNA-binding transcriptional regulator GbsR (MarR family)
MTLALEKAKDDLIQEMGRLSSFAGFNKGMGQIYGLLYLSMEPVSLSDIAGQLGISKGNASLNMRAMERWGLIHPISKKGDRRDYYQAETDFWKIIHGILTERDRKEIDHTLNSIAGILEAISAGEKAGQGSESSFYKERLEQMLDFGKAINQMIKAFLTMDSFRTNSLIQSQQETGQTRRIEIED